MTKFIFSFFTPTPNERHVKSCGFLALVMVWGFIFYLLSLLFAGPAYAQRGLEFLGITGKNTPGELFEKLFFFGLGLVGLAALIVLVFGGIMYLTAGDSADQTKRARGYMTNAIFGLVLAFLSWLILFTINPDIVQVLNLNLKDITLKLDIQFKPSQLNETEEKVLNNETRTVIYTVVPDLSQGSTPRDIAKALDREMQACEGRGGDNLLPVTGQGGTSATTRYTCGKCTNGRGGALPPSNLPGPRGFSCK